MMRVAWLVASRTATSVSVSNMKVGSVVVFFSRLVSYSNCLASFALSVKLGSRHMELKIKRTDQMAY